MAPICAKAEPINLPEAPIFNLYGQIGLLDMPSARFAPDGELAATVSATPAMDRYTLYFQALPWLETAFRYSRIDTYNPHFDLYDRSLSIKLRLQQETRYWPDIAIGFEDILGTGALGAEYLVASKRIGDFDTTLGIGWHRFGGLASFNNPLGALFSSFKSTSNDFALGGTPSFKTSFHGPKAGLFGGIVWHTPIHGLALIVEASGDKYTRQQGNGAVNIRSPINFGISYEPWSGLQFGAGYLYGSQFGVRATLNFNANDTLSGSRLGKQPLRPVFRTPRARNEASLALLYKTSRVYDNLPVLNITKPTQTLTLADNIFRVSDSDGYSIDNVETYGKSLIITFSGKTSAPTCNDFNALLQAAKRTGFDEIVITSRQSSAVHICKSQPQPLLQNANLVQFASDNQNVVLSDSAMAPDLSGASMLTSDNPSVKKEILEAAKEQQIGIAAISVTSSKIEVAYVNRVYRADAEAIGRLLRIFMAKAPPSVEVFRIVSMAGTIPVSGTTFSRSDIERTLNLYGSATELLPTATITPVAADDPLLLDHSQDKYPGFGYSFSPGYRQSLFDPVDPYRIQFYASLTASVSVTKNFAISATAEANIYDTFNITRVSDSVLPHVRSDFAKYFKQGINGISSIQASYTGKLSPEIYFLARAGYLESMFAGAGGEIYWQPEHKRWAVGASLYAVQQRNFDRLFGLQHYRVVTGHVSLYYDSPFYNLDFAVHAGRYLAGDYGATFQVTRRFDNGVEIGAYATFTNVPFSKFGEGSFDKGIIIHIPLSDLAPLNTQDELKLDFSPLTRDGGQRLLGESVLHQILRRSSEGELLANWERTLHP